MPGELSAAERTHLRTDAAALFQAAIDAVDPTRLIPRFLHKDGHQATLLGLDGTVVLRATLPLTVVGAGKAAARMVSAVYGVVGAESVRGLAITPEAVVDGEGPVELVAASHPLPDERGAAATRRLTEIVRTTTDTAILFLLSGGASSLLVQPRPPVTLADKIEMNSLLLASGCGITELNTVRKHLSSIKGGGLLRAAPCPIAGLILSDVIGDDIGTVGSGPTSPDPTSFADALRVLEHYELTNAAPDTVLRLLRGGRDGKVAETVKPGSVEARRGHNIVIGSNRLAVEAAAQAARDRGWHTIVIDTPLAGDTGAAALAYTQQFLRLSSATPEQPTCVIAGGETTVRVSGAGRGGRNQEFALAVAGEMAGRRALLLSAGTDGIDGPTPAAGAFVDGTTAERARAIGLDGPSFLADNDSNSFFERCGDLFSPGPTGTNVMDIKIGLHLPARG